MADPSQSTRMALGQPMHSPVGEREGERPGGAALWPFIWPFAAAAALGSAMAAAFQAAKPGATGEPARAAEPQWSSANTVALELPTMQLRDFSAAQAGRATLICAPYALHRATIADFAPGHSLVESLQAAGLRRLFITGWRSASAAMRDFTIDTYLADLNVAVDELRPPVDLIGLCQGGWLALLYAARFPAKVRRLVLAGAPIDIAAAQSQLSQVAVGTPPEVFDNLVRAGDGRVLGAQMLQHWGPMFASSDQAALSLQFADSIAPAQRRALERRFTHWLGEVVDLPGAYYLQVVRCIFKENQIASGAFVALGRPVDLAAVRVPLMLIAARDDEIVAPPQLFAVAKRVGTPAEAIVRVVEPCRHLALFLGSQSLRSAWLRAAAWLADGKGGCRRGGRAAAASQPG